MREITLELYPFDELSAKALNSALDEWVQYEADKKENIFLTSDFSKVIYRDENKQYIKSWVYFQTQAKSNNWEFTKEGRKYLQY